MRKWKSFYYILKLTFEMHFRFQKLYMILRNSDIDKDSCHMTFVVEYLCECNLFAMSSKIELTNCFNKEVNGMANLRK